MGVEHFAGGELCQDGGTLGRALYFGARQKLESGLTQRRQEIKSNSKKRLSKKRLRLFLGVFA
jgi:hypothetical protein